MPFTPPLARDYLLIAAQSTIGNQAIAAVHPGRLSPRAVMELSDKEVKRIANAVRTWLQENHPLLFKV